MTCSDNRVVVDLLSIELIMRMLRKQNCEPGTLGSNSHAVHAKDKHTDTQVSPKENPASTELQVT